MTIEEVKELYPPTPVGRAKDITNQTFGSLIALWKTEKTNSGHEAHWLCQCVCGNFKEVNGTELRRGNIKSCGCQHHTYENLIGKTFGRLTVLEEVPSHSANGSRHYWKCQCICGNTTETEGTQLRTGRVQSCGCLQKEKASEYKKLNLQGQKFGRLLVLEEMPERKHHSTVWKCKCDCGNECEILGTRLFNGLTQSCGCLNKERTREIHGGKLTGQRFGKLLVLEDTGKSKNGKIVWKCLCNCGNITEVTTEALTSGNTRSCGCIISHGEQKIASLLQQHNINYQSQKSFATCLYQLNNKQSKARFDFYINNRYLLEYDGQQHFGYTGNGWDTKENFEKTQARDAYKNQWCKDNHIPLIRIPYTHYDDLCIEDLMLETTKFRVEGT